VNYFKAQTLFCSARNKVKGKPIGTATTVVQTEKGYGIKYHNTIVVEYLPDGSCILRSGGWKTVTTKRRINEYSPVRVYQQNFEWYIADGKDTPTPFVDGMIVKA